MSKFKSIVENILQEDAKNDYALIKEAEVVYNMFLDKIKQDSEEVIHWLNNDGYAWIFLFYNHNYPCLFLCSDKIFSAKGSYIGSFTAINIYLDNLLENTPYKEYFTNRNVTIDILLKVLELPKIKSTFLHEYQHFKYDLNDKTKNLQYKVNSEEDYTKYRQNHNENNSFTMQDLNSLITDFKFELERKNININDKKEVLNYLSRYIQNLYKSIGIKLAYDGYKRTFLSNQPYYTKNTHMEKQYYKRIYNLLYYLFIEDNITKAKSIYNQIKKDIGFHDN